MKIVIFAGGSGKRFWPASTKTNPKQFQDVIGNKPLIKLKYDYLRLGFKADDIFISTGFVFKKEVESILPELPKQNFIYEPSMRDTGPAVLFATEYIYKKYGDVSISLQWADHYIKNPNVFIKLLKYGEQIVEKTNTSIVVGVPIRYPSHNLGHIKNGEIIKSLDKNGNIKLAKFKKFVEKPTYKVAEEYIKNGDYTWNTGYFISKPSLIIQKYKTFAPQIYSVISNISKSNFSKESLKKFESLEKISFDYIFAENLSSKEALVLIANMGWSDVGEWVALKEALQKNNKDTVTKGNVIDYKSEDCLIYNYDNLKTISTFYLKDMVVVNTAKSVAIFPKNKNGELKAYIKMLEEKGQTQLL